MSHSRAPLNATAYLSFVMDMVSNFANSIPIIWWQSSSDLKLVSWTWQWVHFSKWPPVTDLNLIDQLWALVELVIWHMGEKLTNLQKLRDDQNLW